MNLKMLALLGTVALSALTVSTARAENMNHESGAMMSHEGSTHTMDHGDMMKKSPVIAYDAAAFEADLAAKKPVALVFYKEGCPTCIKQEPFIEKSASAHGVTVYRVDYTNDRETVKKYKVGMQSTLIVFKDGQMVQTTSGVTDEAELDATIKAAI